MLRNARFIGQQTLVNFPLLIQESSWEGLSIDFMLGLLQSQQGFDIVIVVFDRNSKMAHFIASKKTSSATCLEFIFQSNYSFHGVCEYIILDRDIKSVSHFWSILWKRFNTSLNFSSTSHSQSNGQTEVVNQTLGNLVLYIFGEKPK